MAEPATYQRLYRDSTGLEYPAPPHVVKNVLRSMQDSARGDHPFRVRFRLDDGTVTTVRPKNWRS